MNKIKVLLVDDHAVVRAGFRMMLASNENIEIAAEADRGETACQLYLEKQPDVVILDLSMPGIGGLECIRRIRLRDPSAKILIFSVHDERVFINRAIEAGASGYLSKSSDPKIVVEAVRRIAAGQPFFESGGPAPRSEKKDRLPTETGYQTMLNCLSPREFDIFCLLAKGMTARKIAGELCLGYKTVANYGTQIKTKLNVSTVAELAHIATALGIIKN